MREIYIYVYTICKSCEATYHVGSVQRMSSRCARKDRSRLSIEASGVLLIRASRRSASNIQLSTGCPRRVVPLRLRPRVILVNDVLSPPFYRTLSIPVLLPPPRREDAPIVRSEQK